MCTVVIQVSSSWPRGTVHILPWLFETMHCAITPLLLMVSAPAFHSEKSAEVGVNLRQSHILHSKVIRYYGKERSRLFVKRCVCLICRQPLTGACAIAAQARKVRSQTLADAMISTIPQRHPSRPTSQTSSIVAGWVSLCSVASHSGVPSELVPGRTGITTLWQCEQADSIAKLPPAIG